MNTTIEDVKQYFDQFGKVSGCRRVEIKVTFSSLFCIGCFRAVKKNNKMA